ncbi:MAG: histone-like nucleoid-structuring protein Lsr2, partial [Patescibacteria group bacterium]
DSMADFVAKARRTNGRAKRSAPTTKGTSHNKEQSRAIRLWAKANGHDLADRGRIPASVVEAFELAHR